MIERRVESRRVSWINLIAIEELEKRVYNEALQQIETDDASEKRGIVASSSSWHLGVIGIVAASESTL